MTFKTFKRITIENTDNYRKHFKKELFPVIDKVYLQKDWIFIQDSVHQK